MTRITDFNSLSEKLKRLERQVRVAVACPADSHTEAVVARAIGEGLCTFVLVATAGKTDVAERLKRQGGDSIALLTADDAKAACQMAVREVREGRADVLMKGTVNTDVLLRAVLDKEQGLLEKGRVLTHVAIAQVERLARLLLFTDAAVIPYPTQEQLRAMIGYACETYYSVVGSGTPLVALTHCTEQTSEKFPVTLSYAALKEACQKGELGNVVVDGPMDVKTALDRESGALKGIASPVVGNADVIVFPDIEAGNTFYKTLTFLCPEMTVAGMLCGTTAPVVVTSRADTAASKYCSLVAACAKAANR